MALAITPGGAVASPGGTVEFSVPETDGAGYAWKRNGVAIGGATSAKLTISPVTADDAGAYTATVTPGTGGPPEQSSAAYLVVRGEAPLEWDDGFAGTAIAIGILLLAVVSWPLFWGLVDTLQNSAFPGNFSSLVAIELALVGTALALLSVVVALLELRGRSRKPAPPVAPAAGRPPDPLTGFAWTLLEPTGELDTNALGLLWSAAQDAPENHAIRVLLRPGEPLTDRSPAEMVGLANGVKSVVATAVAPAAADAAGTAAATAGGSLASVIAGAAPDTIKAWGSLKVTAALLLAALGLFAGGATLAWNSQGKGADGGTTPTGTSTPATTTPPTATP